MNLSLCEVISSSVSESLDWFKLMEFKRESRIILIQRIGSIVSFASTIYKLQKTDTKAKFPPKLSSMIIRNESWIFESHMFIINTEDFVFSRASVCKETNANAPRQRPLKLNGEGTRTYSLNKPLRSPKAYKSLKGNQKDTRVLTDPGSYHSKNRVR